MLRRFAEFERRFYGGLSMLSVVLAALCLTWQPLRFGAAFFGILAVGCAGEWIALRKAGRCPVCRRISRIGRFLFLIFLASLIAIEGMIWAGAQPDAAAYTADHVLVLGARCYGNTPSASLRTRLDAALDLMDKSDAVVILCGGQGDDEIAPESHIMQAYLLERGADPARLRLEDQSRNTIQNIENAKALLPEGAKTAVITNGFHLARAKRLMARAGLDPVGLPAPTPYFAFRAVCCLREYCSTLGLILTGRYF